MALSMQLRDCLSMHVLLRAQCVIGAGAAGLVAARELLREGHQPTVFEQGSRAGGVWVYTEETEEGEEAEAQRQRSVHSSMYRNLGDTRRFCGHEEVSVLLIPPCKHATPAWHELPACRRL